jgi:hypothetical protein
VQQIFHHGWRFVQQTGESLYRLQAVPGDYPCGAKSHLRDEKSAAASLSFKGQTVRDLALFSM